MRGGKREGAGRPEAAPELKKMPIAIKLPQWLLTWMDTQPASRAVIVEEAIKVAYKINAPPVADRTPD